LQQELAVHFICEVSHVRKAAACRNRIACGHQPLGPVSPCAFLRNTPSSLCNMLQNKRNAQKLIRDHRSSHSSPYKPAVDTCWSSFAALRFSACNALVPFTTTFFAFKAAEPEPPVDKSTIISCRKSLNSCFLFFSDRPPICFSKAVKRSRRTQGRVSNRSRGPLTCNTRHCKSMLQSGEYTVIHIPLALQQSGDTSPSPTTASLIASPNNMTQTHQRN
jgi:hypothetical protein